MAYQSYVKKMPGRKAKKIMLFALSTCQWCKKTKALLSELGLEYDFVDVDLLLGFDRDEAYGAMQRHQSASFPTIIINNGEEVIVGFDEEKLKKIIKT